MGAREGWGGGVGTRAVAWKESTRQAMVVYGCTKQKGQDTGVTMGWSRQG